MVSDPKKSKTFHSQYYWSALLAINLFALCLMWIRGNDRGDLIVGLLPACAFIVGLYTSLRGNDTLGKQLAITAAVSCFVFVILFVFERAFWSTIPVEQLKWGNGIGALLFGGLLIGVMAAMAGVACMALSWLGLQLIRIGLSRWHG